MWLVHPGVVTEAGALPELQMFSPLEESPRPPEEVEAGENLGGGVEEGVSLLGVGGTLVGGTLGGVPGGEDLLAFLSRASSITTYIRCAIWGYTYSIIVVSGNADMLHRWSQMVPSERSALHSLYFTS